MANLLAADLDHILSHTAELFNELRGEYIFITGGTGFFGCWLLESFAWANDKLGLGSTAVVLTRNVDAFKRKAPHLASHPAIQFHSGDVRSFEFPPGPFSHIIHAATETTGRLSEDDPLAMLDVIGQGTRRTLEFARSCGATKYLLISSGAVYGKQPSELTHIPEDYPGAPDTTDPGSAYGQGKRLSEFLCSVYSEKYALETKIARCFAFVGPYLPLDAHFAIGNFIHDGLRGKSIHIKGDGTPYRSYLYAADLAIWLWTILFRGTRGRAYNVGSEDDFPISHIAYLAASSFEPVRQVQLARSPIQGQAPTRYVPMTQRARSDLQLCQTIDLSKAIKRTIAWYSAL